jgi:hypothetical protein
LPRPTPPQKIALVFRVTRDQAVFVMINPVVDTMIPTVSRGA